MSGGDRKTGAMCLRRRGRLAKKYLKAQRNGQSYFFSPTNEWCLTAPFVMKPEERDFVVDSRASMHMLSSKDVNSAELETVRVSKSPMTVVTANGEVHTKEEATVHVKDLDLFVAVKLLEDTAGCSLTRKTLPRSRTFLRVDQWPEATTHQRWQTDKVQHGELRTDRCPWFIDKLFKPSYTYISNISIAGSSSSCKHPASTRSESTSGTAWASPSHEPAENRKRNRNGDNETVRGNPLLDLPEWLEEFTENLEDESVPAHRDAPASSSRVTASEPRGKVVSVSGKH